MDGQAQPQPCLMSGVRRFGRYDKFQNISSGSSGHASIGGKSVGKISIDCQFAFKQSQWGVLGEDQCPVGVLYINLNFSPPQDCKLKSATVTVTLDDEDRCLASYQRARTPPTRGSNTPVQITDWYGPKQLTGQARTIDKTRFKQFIPEANFMGTGGGGVGGGSQTSFQQSVRWLFSGQLLPGKKTGLYRKLQWDLVENELEKQPSRSNRVYTAFSFVHSGQPFLMKVDVDGRLEKWDKQLLSKLHFGNVKQNARDGQVVTLIDFAEYDQFQDRLDDVVHSLPRVMEMKNFQETPPVVPEPTEATFVSVPSPGGQPECQGASSIRAEDRVQEIRATSTRMNGTAGNTSQHLLPEPTRQSAPWTAESGIAPSIADLMEMVQSLSSANDRQSVRGDSPFPSTENTVVGITSDDGLVEPESPPQDDTSNIKDVADERTQEVIQINVLESSNRPDLEAVVRILQIPALLGVIRVLVTLMSLLGYLPAEEKTPHVGNNQGPDKEQGKPKSKPKESPVKKPT
jgi:hypothetical protein